MKIIFEFLFYCLYQMSALVKRIGVRNEDIACFFYSLLLFLNTSVVFFTLRIVIPKGALGIIFNTLAIKLLLVLPFLVWYLICRHYFIKKNNARRIITKNEIKYKNKNMAIIGVLYFIFSFLAFIGMVLLLSD